MSDFGSPVGPHASLDDDQLRGKPQLGLSAFEAFKFGFTGPGIVGLLIGLVLFFIPLVGMVVLLGWLAESHRRLVRGIEPAVRPFDPSSLGDYLKAGLFSFIPQLAIGFLISVPMMFVMMIGMGAGGALFSATQSGALLALMGLGGFLIVLTFSFVSILLVKAVQIRAELTGDLKAAFDFEGVKGLIKRQYKPMLLHSFLLGLLCVPAMFLGMMAFFIGVYVVAVATQFMLMHLRHQIYLHDVAGGGEKLNVMEGGGALI